MTETAASPRSVVVDAGWIQGPWADLLLFVGTPLLLLPLILAGAGSPDIQQLLLYAGALGSLGHHLPGMMRAYGDRDLFRRFRGRFLLAPLLLVSVCIFFSLQGLGGVILITFFWTTWHTLMQIFGFARIYDAKVGSFARRTSRLDHALCITWIGAPILLSDSRLGSVLELYYRTGAPLLPAVWIQGLKTVWIGATALATVAFLVHYAIGLRQGHRQNPIKLLLMASSFGFWWLCMAQVDHLLVGIALFDIFHDVQYLALVWLFNRQRADKGARLGGFSRFLFRRSGALIGLYVGLVLAYGATGFWAENIRTETVRDVLLGIVAASALLHFYFDGFIWKVRESSVQASLGLKETAAGEGFRLQIPALQHAAKWLLFLVPVVLLGVAEAKSERAEREWRQAIVDVAPDSAEALTSLGATLLLSGAPEEAIELHRRALQLKPRHAEAHHNLAVALRVTGQLNEAESHFRQAIEILPDFAKAHGHLANLHAQRGREAERLSADSAPHYAAAELHYREAIRHDARYADPRANFAVLLVQRGRLPEAVSWFREALRLQPDNQGALNNLAWIYATSADPELSNGAEAIRLAQHLAALTEHEVPQVLDTLAAAYAAQGRYDDARVTAGKAIRLAVEQRQGVLAQQIRARVALYEQGRPYQR